MSDTVHLKKWHYITIVSVALVFLMFCAYGYFLLKEGQKKDNCWDNYQTEQQAIEMCEEH